MHNARRIYSSKEFEKERKKQGVGKVEVYSTMITHRRVLENAIRENELRLEAIMDALLDKYNRK